MLVFYSIRFSRFRSSIRDLFQQNDGWCFVSIISFLYYHLYEVTPLFLFNGNISASDGWAWKDAANILPVKV